MAPIIHSKPHDMSMGSLGKGLKALDRVTTFFISVWSALCVYVEGYLRSLKFKCQVFICIFTLLNLPLGSYAITESNTSWLFCCQAQLHSVHGMGTGDGI